MKKYGFKIIAGLWFLLLYMTSASATIYSSLDALYQKNYVTKQQIQKLLNPDNSTEAEWEQFLARPGSTELVQRLWEKYYNQDYIVSDLSLPVSFELLDTNSQSSSNTRQKIHASIGKLLIKELKLNTKTGRLVHAYAILHLDKFLSCRFWGKICVVDINALWNYVKFFKDLEKGAKSSFQKRTEYFFPNYRNLDVRLDSYTKYDGSQYWDSLPDAFRHSYITARLSKHLKSSRWAEKIMAAYEEDNPNRPYATVMDLNSNRIGAKIYDNLPNKSVSAIERKLLTDQCYTHINANPSATRQSIENQYSSAVASDELIFVREGIMNTGSLTPYEQNGTCPRLINFDVGILSDDGRCPDSSTISNTKITITMEDERNKNDNRTSGYTGAIFQNLKVTSREIPDPDDSAGNYDTITQTTRHYLTTYEFCRVDGRAFKALTYDDDSTKNYAVLKLGTDCPNGSKSFGYQWDNQDGGNLNSIVTDSGYAPNTQGRNTQLQFCLFTKEEDVNTSLMSAFPNFEIAGSKIQYAVFAASDFSLARDTGYIYHDDEDKTNTSKYLSRATGDSNIIVKQGKNTLVRIAMVDLDHDGDKLTYTQELAFGTTDTNPDNDGDDISDFDEVMLYKSNPLDSDSDGDGLFDNEEIGRSLLLVADSDRDGINDRQEIDNGTNPMFTDSDADNLDDKFEILYYKTDPTNPDSDADGVKDGDEVLVGRNPKLNEPALVVVLGIM